MSLDMSGHIDGAFKSLDVIRTPVTGSYIDGIWSPTNGTPSTHAANVQPLNHREIQQLQQGGERITETWKLYINDGDLFSIAPSDIWTFDTGKGVKKHKAISMDCRPWRNYCKIIVSLIDDQ